MRVILAESAGFCYGVHRAVDLARKAAEERGRCWMLGDLIHNAHVVDELRSAGIEKTEDPAALRRSDTVIIRSHGERRDVLEALAAKGVRMVDAACPNVTRIQKLAAKAGEDASRETNTRVRKTSRRQGWNMSDLVRLQSRRAGTARRRKKPRTGSRAACGMLLV